MVVVTVGVVAEVVTIVVVLLVVEVVVVAVAMVGNTHWKHIQKDRGLTEEKHMSTLDRHRTITQD